MFRFPPTQLTCISRRYGAADGLIAELHVPCCSADLSRVRRCLCWCSIRFTRNAKRRESACLLWWHASQSDQPSFVVCFIVLCVPSCRVSAPATPAWCPRLDSHCVLTCIFVCVGVEARHGLGMGFCTVAWLCNARQDHSCTQHRTTTTSQPCPPWTLSFSSSPFATVMRPTRSTYKAVFDFSGLISVSLLHRHTWVTS